MIKNSLSVYSIKYGETTLPESMLFDGSSSIKPIPISFAFYLIETEDKKILVDAGCNAMPGFNMKKHYSPAFAIRTVGVTADEITDVIITHAHHDHIEAVSCFKNAVVHISEEEYINGEKYIPDNMMVSVFKDKYVIAPQITVIKWGGHSVGSAIIEIKDNDVTHILAGDECYVNANIENKICTGTSCNKEKSLDFIKKYSNKKYSVHTCHDILLKTEIDLKNIYVRNVRIIGSTLRSRTPEVKAQILAELVEKVWPKVESGEVKPTIYKVLPIQEAEAAHDILYKGQNVGKVVLTV